MGSDNGPRSERSTLALSSRDLMMISMGILACLAVTSVQRSKGASEPSWAPLASFGNLRQTEAAAVPADGRLSPPSALLRSTANKAEGWHPIHVYYGSSKIITDGIPEKWRVVDVEKNKDGKEWFGQHGQDVAVAKFLKFKEGGYFVDLAANDAVWASNTFALERNFGWGGLCIEPNHYYWDRLASRRCHVVGAVVGEKDMDEVRVRLSPDKGSGPFGGIIGDKFDNKKKSNKDERRFTASLLHIFELFEVPSVIDYMSFDVEGAEEFIISTFPFHKYKFLTMTIERPKEGMKSLLEKNGYKWVRDFRHGDTLWAHESVYEQGKTEVEKNPKEIDSHIVENLQ